MLTILTTILLTVFANWQGGQVAQSLPAVQHPAEDVMTSQDNRHHEATLTDATSLYRICSSRPQRLLPTQGSKTERTTSFGGFARRHIVKPIQFLHDSRRRTETAPFCLSASCHYYVIALRHIIR